MKETETEKTLTVELNDTQKVVMFKQTGAICLKTYDAKGNVVKSHIVTRLSMCPKALRRILFIHVVEFVRVGAFNEKTLQREEEEFDAEAKKAFYQK